MPRIEIELVEQEGPDRVAGSVAGGPWRVAVRSGGLLLLESGFGDQGGGVHLCGRIHREGSIMDIVGCISTSRWTGTLTVVGGRARRELSFVSGALRMAGSTVGSDRLGEVMRRKGRITQAELDEALGEVGPERRLGRVLVSKGAATPGEVFDMLHRQVEEIFFSTVAVREGFFVFDPELDLDKLPASISLDVNRLLLEGARRIDELAMFRRLIPGMNIVLQRKTRSFPPRAEGVGEKFLARCDGRRTLSEVAGEIGLAEYDAVRLAHGFLVDGALEVIPTEATRDESIRFLVDRYNEIVDTVVSAVSATGDAGSFIEEVRSFPMSPGAFEDSTRRLLLERGGHLLAENVATILRDARVPDRMGHLVQILTQYLFFVLFCADTRLSREEHRRVGAHVHAMLQKIGS